MPIIFILLALTAVFAHPLNTAVRGEAGAPAFSYVQDSGIGPADWGTIKSFETCATGESQSPIDLPPTGDVESMSDGPKPHMTRTKLRFEHTTENFELACEHAGDCGFTIIDGKRFELVNLHFHAPSEHKLAGEQFPLEAHMVHRSKTGELAVISTLFRFPRYLRRYRAGKTSGAHQEIERAWRQCEKGKEEIYMNLRRLIGDKGYVAYSGSLTTPPCTEGVKWFIAQTIPKISADEYERYMALAEAVEEVGNNRPTQPLHKRTLTAYVRR